MKGEKRPRGLAQASFRAVAHDRAADLARRGETGAHLALGAFPGAGLHDSGGSDGLKALSHKQKLPARREAADSQSV